MVALCLDSACAASVCDGHRSKGKRSNEPTDRVTDRSAQLLAVTRRAWPLGNSVLGNVQQHVCLFTGPGVRVNLHMIASAGGKSRSLGAAWQMAWD